MHTVTQSKAKSGPPRMLSDAQIALVRGLAEAGYSKPRLARWLGVSRATVFRALRVQR